METPTVTEEHTARTASSKEAFRFPAGCGMQKFGVFLRLRSLSLLAAYSRLLSGHRSWTIDPSDAAAFRDFATLLGQKKEKENEEMEEETNKKEGKLCKRYGISFLSVRFVRVIRERFAVTKQLCEKSAGTDGAVW